MARKLASIEQRFCKQCKEVFFTVWDDRIYCNKKCRTKANNDKKDKQLKCPNCHHKFRIKESLNED